MNENKHTPEQIKSQISVQRAIAILALVAALLSTRYHPDSTVLMVLLGLLAGLGAVATVRCTVNAAAWTVALALAEAKRKAREDR